MTNKEANLQLAAQLLRVLNYVADMTYCGSDAEWHFKKGYDPQTVLDEIASYKEPHFGSDTIRLLRQISDKEKIASLMIRTGIATGHGDTIDDLLRELEGSILELQKYKIKFREKEEAMDILFDLLEEHGIDYSHLIP